jgi:SAM-dependent methyltransferase
MARVRQMLAALLPHGQRAALRRWKLDRLRRRNAGRPLREVFAEIYARNQWGGQAGELSSGSGSTASQAAAYVAEIRSLMQERGVRTVLDLGCGDFRVGSLLAAPGVDYCGVDVVPDVIAEDARRHAGPGVRFLCADLLEDPLPAADLCLVRQVFQHLSNDEILRALARLSAYPMVVFTEHLPAPGLLRVANLDKPHGADTRVVDGSGVFLDQAPFGLQVRTLAEAPAETWLVAPGEILRSVLWQPSASATRQDLARS